MKTKNLLDRIKMWWQHKDQITRSSKEGDRLTDYEQDTIRRTGNCPDCGSRLKEGPHGGMAVNQICLGCHSEFSLTMIGNTEINGGYKGNCDYE